MDLYCFTWTYMNLSWFIVVYIDACRFAGVVIYFCAGSGARSGIKLVPTLAPDQVPDMVHARYSTGTTPDLIHPLLHKGDNLLPEVSFSISHDRKELFHFSVSVMRLAQTIVHESRTLAQLLVAYMAALALGPLAAKLIHYTGCVRHYVRQHTES